MILSCRYCTVAQEASIGGQVAGEATKEAVLQRYMVTNHWFSTAATSLVLFADKWYREDVKCIPWAKVPIVKMMLSRK